MNPYRRRLDETLPEVRGRIAEAARRAGREPGEIRIVGVTKGHPNEAIEAAVEVGLRDLGENRIEELEAKVARVPAGAVRWHMVGRMQRRKAPGIRGLAQLLHSLDSIRLAERLEATAPEEGEPLAVLVQVNTSGEGSKSGFEPPELLEGLDRILAMGSLRVKGLMTMAPFTDDESVLRGTFRGLRELHDEAVRRLPAYAGRELSMGMSNDFELAVEEGSTIVRLGTVLFGGR